MSEENKKTALSIKMVIVICSLSFLIVAAGSFFVYTKSYDQRVFPNVYLGDIYVGKMSKTELKAFLNKMNEKITNEGLKFKYRVNNQDNSFVLYPINIGGEQEISLVSFDVDTAAEALINYGKSGRLPKRSFSLLENIIRKKSFVLKNININKELLTNELDAKLLQFQNSGSDANVKVDSFSENLSYTLIPSSQGFVFDYDAAANDLMYSLSRLKTPEITIKTKTVLPSVLEKDVASILDKLPQVVNAGGFELSYQENNNKKPVLWKLEKKEIVNWMQVKKNSDGLVGFGLNEKEMKKFLSEKVAPEVEVKAQNARFKIGTNGKVVEFQNAENGLSLNIDQTFASMDKLMFERTWNNSSSSSIVQLVLDKTEAEIKTDSINNLGIKEILGVGFSNFGGSPGNRIKNISHAVNNKLNGMLIKPGEEFSLVNALKPFTLEDGYFSELVIEGDRVKPGIGGGLCQVGTTMFRTAMNAGLEITQRKNHSLVVAYYTDPSNGNPGTDATIYDPNPDFRFLNDTGNYILLTTEMNTKTGDLRFTMWGTNDGRKGYYTAPKVSKWMPYGETKYIETDELPPGKEDCQAAHKGAIASFTYIREMPNGEKIEKVYDSYYKPLPKICMVGKGTVSNDNSTASSTISNLPANQSELPKTEESTVEPKITSSTAL